jgi:hypothetical protein
VKWVQNALYVQYNLLENCSLAIPTITPMPVNQHVLHNTGWLFPIQWLTLGLKRKCIFPFSRKCENHAKWADFRQISQIFSQKYRIFFAKTKNGDFRENFVYFCENIRKKEKRRFSQKICFIFASKKLFRISPNYILFREISTKFRNCLSHNEIITKICEIVQNLRNFLQALGKFHICFANLLYMTFFLIWINFFSSKYL